MRSIVVALVLLAATLGPAPAAGQEPPAAPAPPPADARIPIAILPLSLTQTTHERYPQLAVRNVGFGIKERLENELLDAGRFRLVLEDPKLVADLLERQWVAASGAVDAASAVHHGRLTGARYVVYGEVYDFATQELKRKESETRISIQVRMVDVETSEYVPASGHGKVTSKLAVYPGEVEFARSTVGIATDQAIREAVKVLLRRWQP